MIDVWDVAAKDAAFQGIGTNPAKARRAVFSAHVGASVSWSAKSWTLFHFYHDSRIAVHIRDWCLRSCAHEKDNAGTTDVQPTCA